MAGVAIRAKVDEGLTFSTPDGAPLRLALVDSSGRIVTQAPTLAVDVFSAAARAYDDFWQGCGHLTNVTTRGIN